VAGLERYVAVLYGRLVSNRMVAVLYGWLVSNRMVAVLYGRLVSKGWWPSSGGGWVS
jgi:hypothetical protein